MIIFILWKVAIIAITMKMEKWYSVKPSPPAIIEMLANVSVNVINNGIALLDLFFMYKKMVALNNMTGIISNKFSKKLEVPLVPTIPCNTK